MLFKQLSWLCICLCSTSSGAARSNAQHCGVSRVSFSQVSSACGCVERPHRRLREIAGMVHLRNDVAAMAKVLPRSPHH
jgi:hypothetical protein